VKKDQPNFSTRVLHYKRDSTKHSGFVNPPVYHGSTVIFPTLDDLDKSKKEFYTPNTVGYGRRGNPTAFALEDTMANLENGYASFSVSSGLAAITTALFTFLKCGDHLLVADTVYQPTRSFCDGILTSFGVEVTYYDPMIGEKISQMIQKNTRCIFLESPGSLTFEIQDVPAIARIAIDNNITTVIDNTWASPYFFRPLDHGINVSINAATKYIVGHSDAMLGLITTDEAHYLELRKTKEAIGHCVGPDDLYLGIRGIRTLPLRMQQHQQQALDIVNWLNTQADVIRVLHPALETCPGHDIWKRDFEGSSGLFSFEIESRSRDALAYFLDNLEIFSMGASWGAFESLIFPIFPDKLRTATSWHQQGTILRIHAGLENIDDLICDLEAGLNRYRSKK
jgi:cystathionine beta-lyase